MGIKGAGGRFHEKITGSFNLLTGSVAAYLNRPVDPRLSVVEVVCCGAIMCGAVGLASEVGVAERFRLVAGLAGGPGLAAGMGAAAVVYFALLFLVDLPHGARLAGALYAAAISGAVVELMIWARASAGAVLVGLVLGPAAVLQLRCRMGWLKSLAVSAAGAFVLALLQDYLR